MSTDLTAPTTPDAVLDATADWFAADPDRWGRDAFIDRETHCRCAMGGIAYVLDPYDWEANPTQLRGLANTTLGRRAVALLHDYLIDHHGVEPRIDDDALTVVANWNDDETRTVGEVIALMRATAADYRDRQAARAARQAGAA